MKQNSHSINFRVVRTMLLFFLLGTGCNNHSQENITPKPDNGSTINAVGEKIPAKYAKDTLVITQAAAVFFTPDPAGREAFKIRVGERPFDGMDHECHSQLNNSKASLKEFWPKVRIYEVIDTVALLFVREDGRKILVDLSSKNLLCGLYIFYPKKDPLPADMMDLGTALDRYFPR